MAGMDVRLLRKKQRLGHPQHCILSVKSMPPFGIPRGILRPLWGSSESRRHASATGSSFSTVFRMSK